MAEREIAAINMSRIPVAGLGGLGMVAAAGVTAYALPAARAFTAVAILGGFLLALLLIVFRRSRGVMGPSGPMLPLHGLTAGPDAYPDTTRRPTDSNRSPQDRLRFCPE